jgi:SAM-dependent methyltransferase
MGKAPGNRWPAEGSGRAANAFGHAAATYDDRWAEMAAAGKSVHGEADFVSALGPRSVLDAGCGTGRVAVELARRGVEVVGLDIEPAMLARARAKSGDVTWIEGDLADLDLGRTFDVVVAAGNVMIFLDPGTEGAVLAGLARHLRRGGALVAGFQLDAGRLDLATYDALAAAAGLEPAGRWATWDRRPFTGGAYAVSVHRKL